MLSQILSRYWWATLLRGVAWVLFGLVVFAWPGMSILTLTMLFGVFVLADGVGNIAAAMNQKPGGSCCSRVRRASAPPWSRSSRRASPRSRCCS